MSEQKPINHRAKIALTG